MKKIIFSISFICYLAVSSGIVINSHYCMKRLVSVHLFESKAKKCGKCGMDIHKSDNGCCRDEMKVVKLDQDQNKLTYASPGIEKIEPLVSVPSPFLNNTTVCVTVSRHFHNHSPPLLSGQDIYLLNRVFRI